MSTWMTHKDLDISIGSLAELDPQTVISSKLGYISSNNRIFSQIEILRRKTH
ncbi:hypothetical protein JCM12298_29680 [Desulfothermus naphthae]